MLGQSVGGGGGGGQGGTPAGSGGEPAATLALQLGHVTEPGSGDGGAVDIADATLDIATEGDNAFGILVQSIGGGGGLVFAQNAAGATIGVQDASASFLSGTGGDVSVDLDSGSQVTTLGAGAIGILAQSIGYGGGVAGYLTSGDGASIGFDDAFSDVYDSASGDGGAVSVNVDADITTSGALAHGIFAQSLGSGGGLMGAGATQTVARVLNGGWNASVGVTQAGSVIATGANASAILAQSNGGATGIGVEVSGSVQGGSGAQGYGIWIDGGVQGAADNKILVNGGGWVSSLSGNAINFTAGTGTIYNNGSIAGGVGDGTAILTGAKGYAGGTSLLNGPTAVVGNDCASALGR